MRRMSQKGHRTNPLSRGEAVGGGQFWAVAWSGGALGVKNGTSDPEHRRSSNLQLEEDPPMTSASSPRPVSALRARMIEDMTVRGFTEETHNNYIREVRAFAAFIHRPPDTATAEDLRRFQLHQTQR